MCLISPLSGQSNDAQLARNHLIDRLKLNRAIVVGLED